MRADTAAAITIYSGLVDDKCCRVLKYGVELNMLRFEAIVADRAMAWRWIKRDRVHSGLRYLIDMPRDRAEPEALPKAPPVNLHMTSCM